MFGLLKLVPWPVWLGAGAAVLATAAIIYGWGYQKALIAEGNRWIAAVWERKQEVQNKNFEIDRVTIRKDADLSTRLQEIDRKWSEPQQQSSAQ